MKIIQGIKHPIYSWASNIEDTAIKQLMDLSKLDIIYKHIAVMPDVHAGIGSTVGSVIPTINAIIPAAVGVDIGCGMIAYQTDLTADRLPDSLADIRSAIEAVVPVGFNEHKEMFISASMLIDLAQPLVFSKHPKIENNTSSSKWLRQLGTLGGGNHFIELCLDESNIVWIMLHSGSRNIGNRIGEYFIEKAKEDMADHLGALPSADLAYLTHNTDLYQDYVIAISWAQEYARWNRMLMMEAIIQVLKDKLGPFKINLNKAINCHHNYVEFANDYCITRKGAISAKKDELGIIPGSMGTKSYIVRGKGNEDSWHSCSHGAGRIMSRSAARKKFTLDDLATQTIGVECRKDKDVIDEIPGAYKDIDEVMSLQSDLVEVLHTLKQVMCIKG